MTLHFDLAHWFWKNLDGEIYSSELDRPLSAAELEAAGDPTTLYGGWTANGGVPTVWPRDANGVQTPEALHAILSPVGLGASLGATSPAVLGAALKVAAKAACDAITAQIVTDSIHQNAYLNAAQIAWAFNGPPTSEPAKTVFAEQAASVAITDPAVFAEVVKAVSLGAMQLSTMFSLVEAAVIDPAATVAGLAAAQQKFNASLATFVADLNSAGLTVTVTAPAPVAVPGLAAA